MRQLGHHNTWENVPREPVSAAIALVGWAGGLGGVTFLGISATTILTGAAIVGANYALSAINKPKSPGAGSGVGSATLINTPEARGNIQQSAPIERWVYGQARVGGAIFFVEDSKPPYLYLGLLLSGRQISDIRGVHISTNDIAFSSFAFDTPITPLPVDGQTYVKSGVSRLTMSFGAGLTTQAIDPIIHADFPNLTTDFRQREIARAVFKFKFGDDASDFEKMWGQGVSIPSPLIDVDGAPVYDPRDPSQFYPSDWRDNAEVSAAMATWKFSRNAALIQRDWMAHPDGVNYPPGRIRDDEVARAADFDDEPVANKDGTSRPRHTIDGVVTLDQSPRTVMEAMLTANRGFMVQSRGRGWVASSTPRTAVTTIDDDMLLGGFEFQCNRAKADLVNEVRARFSSSDREYQDVDAPTLSDEDLIEEDGEVFSKTVRLPFTSDHRAVQTLEKQFLAEARLPRSLSCTIKIKGIADDLDAGAVVQVWSNLYPAMNGLYTVESMGFLDDFSGLSLGLREYDPSIANDWNPAIDEQDFTLPALEIS